MTSPLSAWSMAASSALSSSGETSNVSSSSRATTVTTEPSASGSPSRTTLPPMTFPVATFICQMLLHPRTAAFVPPNYDLCRKRRAAFPELCCLLEGVGELQHAEVIAVAADDLQADRKPVGRASGGDRGRR